MVRCKIRILEGNRKNTVCFFSITTASQKAANTPKSLCQCHRWHQKIKIRKKLYFLNFAVDISCQNSSKNSSVYNKSIRNSIQYKPRILNQGFPLSDPEQHFCTKHSSNDTPDQKKKYMISAVAMFLCPLICQKPGCQNSHCDHGSISVNSQWSNGKKFVFHNFFLPSIQNFRICRFAWSLR